MTNITNQSFSPIPSSFQTWTPDSSLIARAPSPLTRTPKETVNISAQAQEPNLFEGFSDSTTSVKVDPWGTGKNDCLERILRNQGYTNQEIYEPGPDGKILMDQVLKTNNIKNQNIIGEGVELKVPSKRDSQDSAHACEHSTDKRAGFSNTGGDEGFNPFANAYNNSGYQGYNPFANAYDNGNPYGDHNPYANDDGDFETHENANAKGEHDFEAHDHAEVNLENVNHADEQDTPGDSDDGFFENVGHVADKVFNSLFEDDDDVKPESVNKGGEQDTVGDSDDGFLENVGHVADKVWNHLF